MRDDVFNKLLLVKIKEKLVIPLSKNFDRGRWNYEKFAANGFELEIHKH